jgi:hypothetical protein
MTSFLPPTGPGADFPTAIENDSPCCERSPDPQQAVGSFRLGHCDDEAFAERLQRAWQKMLDDELTFGGDWTSEIDGGGPA